MSSQHRAATQRNPLARIWAAVLGIAAMVVAMIALAPAASAHTPSASLTCTQWSVGGQYYESNQNNTYYFELDGKVVAQGSFGASFSKSGAVPADSASHTLVGHIYQNNDPKAQYSKTYNLSVSGCKITATFASPTVSPAQCTDKTAGETVWESVVKPADGSGLTYTMSGPDANHKVTVTATLASGYAFPSTMPTGWSKTDATHATWTYTLQSKKCDSLATFASPTVSPAQCTDKTAGETVWESVVKPADGSGLTYTMSGPDANHKVTVTATLASGYAFPSTMPTGWSKTDASHATWTYTLQSKKCDSLVTPGAVTFTDQCGVNGDTYTIPVTEGVEYLVGEEVVKAGTYSGSGTVTVTAQATDGYVLAKDAVTSWTHTFSTVPCPTTVTPGAVTFTDQCGVDGDSYTIPGTVGVEYLVDGKVIDAGTHAGSGTLTVTAQATDGYVLADGATKSWTHTFSEVPCPTTVTPGAVTFNDQCGTEGDTYTIPATEGVKYLVGDTVVKADTYNGSGTVTVTAQAADGYVLAKDAVTSWTHTFTDESCGTTTSTTPPTTTPTTPPTTTPPTTTPPAGSTTVTPGINGSQCVLVGTAEQITVTTVTVNGISYTVTGDGTTSVTVRAVADAGFALSVPAGWSRNDDGSATIVLTPDSNGVICVGGESSSVDNLAPTTKTKTAVAQVKPTTGNIEVLPTSATASSTIAYTGVNTSQMAMLALLLLAGGALILGVGTMWRRKPRKH